MQYDWILFDADDTLFSFDAFAGLRRVFASFGIDFTVQDHQAFQKINKPLWDRYQKGEIDAKTVKERRFKAWSEKLNVDPIELNSLYQMAMAEICQPFEGVRQTLDKLSGKAKLGIITNGFAKIQQARLTNTGLTHYFEFVVVSETVGITKPHKEIFNHAFSLMGKVNKKRVLMVGDNPTSDIQGGINAGIDTCWIKLGQEYHGDIKPTFTAQNWFELQKVLLAETEVAW